MGVAPQPDAADRPLGGRVVVVTGASSGLGVQFARALAAAGARLVLAARRFDRIEALAAELGDAIPLACDVAVDDDRRRLLDATLAAHGRLDGLVNNAGMTNVVPALHEGVDDFRRILEVNLVAPFALCQLAARTMREQGGGSIVNVSSVQALRSSPYVPEAAYVAAKSGVSGLTRELAMQWARHGIRVNALAPGAFVTEMTGEHFVDGPIAERIRADVPLGRPGREGELDGALVLMLSEASSYLTGQTVVIDGGQAL